ncbi:hypothetical protein [Haloarcula argentinensis]|uniref:DUF8128 domain-containing protein n=1 Tax=Haloarcula argentinensis TaxID=43776 RepID=A0A847UHN8_HALAR|nr:hypothetical protein [Haloarcula argentinensis]NLV13225.1 hypothetical protein [Haloarcula argentinensis]
MLEQLFHYTTKPSEEQVEQLQNPEKRFHSIEVRPPKHEKIPAVPEEFIKAITELQSKWFGLKNTSPVAAFEIRRNTPDKIRFQFSTSNIRLERKLRTHLTNQMPGIQFEDGERGIPVTQEDTVGGGLLTTGRKDWYPLQNEFKEPPNNSITSALHRHAMRDTKFLIQILFQPVIGKPLRRWYWRRRAYQRIGYLRKEKEKLWGSRNATPREKRQADAIEDKAGTNRFHTSIRFLVIGAEEHTRSRVKELSGGFNTFENPDTGQYLNTKTVKAIRESQIIDFAQAVADRRFKGWSRSFQTSVPELAALVSLPSIQQENIQNAQP